MKKPRALTVVIKLGTCFHKKEKSSFDAVPFRVQSANTPLLPGTSSIVDEKTHEPLLPILTLIVDTAVKLQKTGHRVVIVSSGAIGVGLRRMDVDKRPKHLAQLQVSLHSSH